MCTCTASCGLFLFGACALCTTCSNGADLPVVDGHGCAAGWCIIPPGGCSSYMSGCLAVDALEKPAFVHGVYAHTSDQLPIHCARDELCTCAVYALHFLIEQAGSQCKSPGTATFKVLSIQSAYISCSHPHLTAVIVCQRCQAARSAQLRPSCAVHGRLGSATRKQSRRPAAPSHAAPSPPSPACMRPSQLCACTSTCCIAVGCKTRLRRRVWSVLVRFQHAETAVRRHLS